VENVTDRTSNPFGMRAPCEDPGAADGGLGAVYGYGDANADFHLIGHHPGVHGGAETGVPFTRSVAGERLQSVLHELGFAAGAYSDEPRLSNLYASYLYMCVPPEGRDPSPRDYDDLERFFDAELRAINAHVLLPVGERATEHVLAEYTTQARKFDPNMESLHARDIRGRGFLVVPIREPAEWTLGDRERLVSKLQAILDSDYRQTKGVATLIG
jgi:uracil-DNA glycosylase family 4